MEQAVCSRNHCLLLLVNLPDLFQHLIQILDQTRVAHQDLPFLVRHHHVRRTRDPQSLKNLAVLVRDNRKGNAELLLVHSNLLGVVSASNAQYLDVLAQDRILFDRIV